MKGTTFVLLIVMLLVGFALGSALTYQVKPQTTYSIITLTVQPVYHYFGELTCETHSGAVITTYTNFGGTVGLTTLPYIPPTAAVYIVTFTTEAATTTYYTQGATPTC